MLRAVAGTRRRVLDPALRDFFEEVERDVRRFEAPDFEEVDPDLLVCFFDDPELLRAAIFVALSVD